MDKSGAGQTSTGWSKWNTIKAHLYVAAGLRAFLIAYGEYQVIYHHLPLVLLQT